MPQILIEFSPYVLLAEHDVEQFLNGLIEGYSKAKVIVPVNVKMRTLQNEHF